MQPTTTRRSGLVAGAKLAFVAPAVVAALRAGVAAADSAPSDSAASSPAQSPGQVQGLQRRFQLSLCGTNGQSGSGVLQFFGQNGQLTSVVANLTNATPNQGYQLVFLPANNGTPVTVLTLPNTNGSGNLASGLLSLSSLGLSATAITDLTNMLNGTTAGQLVLRATNGGTNLFTACQPNGQHVSNSSVKHGNQHNGHS